MAVTDAVVANEITRLRMKARESKGIFYLLTQFAVAQTFRRPGRQRFPSILVEDSPNRTPVGATKLREQSEHDGQTLSSQLKTDLEL